MRYFCSIRLNATILNAATLAKPVLGAAQRCTGFNPGTLVQCPDGGTLDVTALVEGREQADQAPAAVPAAGAPGGAPVAVPAALGPQAVLEAAVAGAPVVPAAAPAVGAAALPAGR